MAQEEDGYYVILKNVLVKPLRGRRNEHGAEPGPTPTPPRGHHLGTPFRPLPCSGPRSRVELRAGVVLVRPYLRSVGAKRPSGLPAVLPQLRLVPRPFLPRNKPGSPGASRPGCSSSQRRIWVPTRRDRRAAGSIPARRRRGRGRRPVPPPQASGSHGTRKPSSGSNRRPGRPRSPL